ncbi:SRPBCC family protein [Ulvibacter antarcticus]|uniref:Uncharacterized protein YndB with AHSA1/START domain n=1 Tax=Ulvibacter antarcticus TaxID=442714 RepID=A0A3L9YB48_9FLAO|nr:SRPBCC family protein [Ulvibacter antarcticus]RMA57931.1 uncharacterized protein YndB with AHSA1/START domain [Ulvibacter antarcticus]
MEKDVIKVDVVINAPIERVWSMWVEEKHILNWNSASEDWHTTKAKNDLKEGGSFSSRMEAKDGSMGFDFEGVYNQIIPKKLITYTLEDGREVSVEFISEDGTTKLIEKFDAESMNSIEMQRGGWQAILDNFKRYVETTV